jgi:mono/diheme cytochrome c family protein
MMRKLRATTRSASVAASPGASVAASRGAVIAGTSVATLLTALALTALLNRSAQAAEQARYIDWTTAPVATKPGQPPGYVLFQTSCAVCHGSGPGKPGTRALAAKYKGATPALLEERTDLDPAYIKQVVRQGLYVMPFFRKTELSDSDLNAIAAYLTRKRP